MKPAAISKVSTPASDKMKSVGQWNTAWDPFFEFDPAWTDAFMATSAGIYGAGISTPMHSTRSLPSYHGPNFGPN